MGRQRSDQGPDEIAAAEFLKVEIVLCRSRPQAQRVDGFTAVANNRPIERDTDQGRGSARDGLQPSAVYLEGAAQLHFHGLVRTTDLPRIGALQPVVRNFALPAVFD